MASAQRNGSIPNIWCKWLVAFVVISLVLQNPLIASAQTASEAENAEQPQSEGQAFSDERNKPEQARDNSSTRRKDESKRPETPGRPDRPGEGDDEPIFSTLTEEGSPYFDDGRKAIDPDIKID